MECIEDEQPRRQSTVLVDHLLALQPSTALHRVSYLVRPDSGGRDELLQSLCDLAKKIRWVLRGFRDRVITAPPLYCGTDAGQRTPRR